jgi:parallel beta-helix repeat protein
MKIYIKSILILFLIFLLPNIVLAYQTNKPILIENIHATPENPYIIEGYEITNPKGDCIKIINSSNIIIRDNYLHGCGSDEKFQKNTDHYQEGYATLIGNSTKIIFENNILENNFRGFMAYNTPNLKVTKNNINNTIEYSSLWCERCSDSEFSFNYLDNSGTPMQFWVPGERSIGIWIKRSDNVKIHDNIILRSTSDGIAVTGHIYVPSFTAKEDKTKPHPQADWTGLSSNVSIYNNLILDSMEQGVWLVNARNIKVYNNTIRTGCFTYGGPIFTEFNVGDSEFYDNRLLGCLNQGISGAFSFKIYLYNNSFYSIDKTKPDVFMFFRDRIEDVVDLAMRQGAIYQESKDNIEENNEFISISGILAEEMKQKLKYAEIHKTYEAKGWFSCELADGTLDQECIKREEAKGDQGVPKEQLFYSSLMENFDEFVVDNNNFYGRVIIITLIIILIIFIGAIIWKKR